MPALGSHLVGPHSDIFHSDFPLDLAFDGIVIELAQHTDSVKQVLLSLNPFTAGFSFLENDGANGSRAF
jgi:hypothetical protein